MNNFLNHKLFAVAHRNILCCILGLIASFGSLKVDATDKTDLWRASINRLGPVQIGSSLEELDQLAGELEQQKGDGEGCVYFSPLNSERDVSFMFFEGRLVRVDIYSRKTETLSGLRVGDSAERIKQMYAGSINVLDQQDNSLEELLYLASGNPEFSRHRLVFEANHGIVTNYRLGLLPYVNWKEGCAGER